MKRTVPCSSIPNLCFSRNLKQSRRVDSLCACLFKEANFHCLLSYPLQWPSPALWARFMKGFTLIKKNPGPSPLEAMLSMCLCCFMRRTVPCSSIPNLCFSRNLKQSRRVDSLCACLFKEANFHCLLSYPLQWPSPALWARFMKGFTLVKKIPGRVLQKQCCPCVFAAS